MCVPPLSVRKWSLAASASQSQLRSPRERGAGAGAAGPRAPPLRAARALAWRAADPQRLRLHRLSLRLLPPAQQAAGPLGELLLLPLAVLLPPLAPLLLEMLVILREQRARLQLPPLHLLPVPVVQLLLGGCGGGQGRRRRRRGPPPVSGGLRRRRRVAGGARARRQAASARGFPRRGRLLRRGGGGHGAAGAQARRDAAAAVAWAGDAAGAGAPASLAGGGSALGHQGLLHGMSAHHVRDLVDPVQGRIPLGYHCPAALEESRGQRDLGEVLAAGDVRQGRPRGRQRPALDLRQPRPLEGPAALGLRGVLEGLLRPLLLAPLAAEPPVRRRTCCGRLLNGHGLLQQCPRQLGARGPHGAPRGGAHGGRRRHRARPLRGDAAGATAVGGGRRRRRLRPGYARRWQPRPAWRLLRDVAAGQPFGLRDDAAHAQAPSHCGGRVRRHARLQAPLLRAPGARGPLRLARPQRLVERPPALAVRGACGPCLGQEPRLLHSPRGGTRLRHVLWADRDGADPSKPPGRCQRRGGVVPLAALAESDTGAILAAGERQRLLHPVAPVLPHDAVRVGGAPDLRLRGLHAGQVLVGAQQLPELLLRNHALIEQLLGRPRDLLVDHPGPPAHLQPRHEVHDQAGDGEVLPLQVGPVHRVLLVRPGRVGAEVRMEAEYHLVQHLRLGPGAQAARRRPRVRGPQGRVVVLGQLLSAARGVVLVRVAPHQQREGVDRVPLKNLGADLDGLLTIPLV
mmetsp:Transcript_110429/g.299617  ORF Transcript_110429/g.299617 Transcript_110429/m.299617 type:complete len:741 (-) Transcript_110429:458-2680(-)